MRAAAIDRARRVRGLYAVTPDAIETQALATAVRAAIEGGAAIVQYRNKVAPPALRHEQASLLAQLCREHGTLFIVNDDARLAAAVGADGVHIGEHDGVIAQARATLASDRLVGVSCYNDLALARTAAAGGADYVAFGSFFPSQVKPDARRADVRLLREARALQLPLVAIGGVTRENAALVRDAGADAVAVISDVFGAGDAAAMTTAARSIARLFRHPGS